MAVLEKPLQYVNFLQVWELKERSLFINQKSKKLLLFDMVKYDALNCFICENVLVKQQKLKRKKKKEHKSEAFSLFFGYSKVRT